MTAHLNDSDRQALRLAQDLREEMRAALPHSPAPPSVSPFVDQGGMPSVLLRMDAETARALMAVLAERRGAAAEQRRADGSHVPPPVPPPAAQAVPAAQGPVVAALPYGEPAYGQAPYAEAPYVEGPYAEAPYAESPYAGAPYAGAPYAESPYAESPYVPPQPSPAVFTGGTGPTPLVPSVYPTH
ncbi:hypothetical protein BKA00_001229 [Actinomadura coerulea]|uniref:Uncharacterized protein n=1 Tax=Actinomadura coerulea TaxID=46159 RepID=A0A7X0FW87_9ACTN|nr:hypothetical protein [Actinomadura coerulea]MBB6394315.1 hypothetical protein [Actinomadura coerulea]GGQ42408.1 hypothetical protein GCM10010187_71080 [Actinomadura coerulea]